MQRPHILLIHVSKSTYLFPVSWEIKYTPYIVNTHYISCGGGGEPPQSVSLHSRGNISMESNDQAKEQSRPLQHIVDSKPFLIFPPKIPLHIVCIFNIRVVK
jgi:hypothetical protein